MHWVIVAFSMLEKKLKRIQMIMIRHKLVIWIFYFSLEMDTKWIGL